MSMRVLIICGILLILGAAGLLDIATRLTRGGAHFNSFVLFLPAGAVLLLGVPGARIMADIAFIVNYLLLGIIALLPHLAGPPASSPFAGIKAFAFVFATCIAAVLALLHWQIHTPPFDEHLER